MAEAQIDPEFWQRFRERFLQSRRDALGVITGGAEARGDLPPGLSPGTIADVVFGAIWYRALATGELPGSTLADELVIALAGPHPRVRRPRGDDPGHGRERSGHGLGRPPLTTRAPGLLNGVIAGWYLIVRPRKRSVVRYTRMSTRERHAA